MSVIVTPDRRTEILAAMKDQGLSVTQASEQFQVHQTTIRKWIRKKVDNAHASSSETVRLRREVALLKEIVADFFLEKKAAEKNERIR